MNSITKTEVALLKRYDIDTQGSAVESRNGDYVEFGDVFAVHEQVRDAQGQAAMASAREAAWARVSSLTIHDIQPVRSPKFDQWFEAGWTAVLSILNEQSMLSPPGEQDCEICEGTGVTFGKRCECALAK